jgi:hypothetical protein
MKQTLNLSKIALLQMRDNSSKFENWKSIEHLF